MLVDFMTHAFVLIVILSPITQSPGGPLDKPLNEIAAKLGATAEQILMAWTKAKGAVVVT
jgi:diketogulonate reductase-like aldo/keto reductase